MKILSATLQNTSPKNCAALILADIHLTFEMVQYTGRESCYLLRPSPCNWLQSNNLNHNNSQLEIQLHHLYKAGRLIS